MPGRRSFDDTVSDFTDREISNYELPTPGPNRYKNYNYVERNSPSNSYLLPEVSPRTQVNLFDPTGNFRDAAASPSAVTTTVRDVANEVLSDIDQNVSEESDRVSVRPRAVDRRRYQPVGSDLWPVNVFGASATRMRSQRFKQNTEFCVDRATRRQVLFAKRKAGHGYRRRKRRGPFSNFRC